MKKKEIVSLIFWLAVFGGYIAYFFTVIQPFYSTGDSGFSDSGWFAYFGLFVLTIAISTVVTSILYEILHIIGAKMGGYKVVSVNIMRFNWYRDDDKIKFRFAKFDGLTGETKIVPNTKRKKEANPTWFIFLNSVFFVIEFTALYFVFFYFKNNTSSFLRNLAHGALTFGLTAGVIWLYNILPVEMENKTDGHIFSISKGKEKRKEFNKKLIEEFSGTLAISQVSEENEEPKGPVITGNNVESIYAAIMLNEKDKAIEIIDALLLDKEQGKNQLMLKAWKFFIQSYDASLDDGKVMYAENFSLEERRSVSGSDSLVCIAAYILMAGLYDKSQSECIYVLEKTPKLLKRVPTNKKEVEIKMVNASIDKVLGFHPNWDLAKYKIAE